MAMIEIYKYLYYRLYTWNLRSWGESELPQFNALFGVSFMVYMNVGIIAIVLELIGFKIFIDDTPKLLIVTLGTLILVVNYFWLVHNRKYKKIENKYKNEPKERRLKKTILLWLYFLFSFLIFIFMAILTGKIKGYQ